MGKSGSEDRTLLRPLTSSTPPGSQVEGLFPPSSDKRAALGSTEPGGGLLLAPQAAKRALSPNRGLTGRSEAGQVATSHTSAA